MLDEQPMKSTCMAAPSAMARRTPEKLSPAPQQLVVASEPINANGRLSIGNAYNQEASTRSCRRDTAAFNRALSPVSSHLCMDRPSSHVSLSPQLQPRPPSTPPAGRPHSHSSGSLAVMPTHSMRHVSKMPQRLQPIEVRPAHRPSNILAVGLSMGQTRSDQQSPSSIPMPWLPGSTDELSPVLQSAHPAGSELHNHSYPAAHHLSRLGSTITPVCHPHHVDQPQHHQQRLSQLHLEAADRHAHDTSTHSSLDGSMHAPSQLRLRHGANQPYLSALASCPADQLLTSWLAMLPPSQCQQPFEGPRQANSPSASSDQPDAQQSINRPSYISDAMHHPDDFVSDTIGWVEASMDPVAARRPASSWQNSSQWEETLTDTMSTASSNTLDRLVYQINERPSINVRPDTAWEQ